MNALTKPQIEEFLYLEAKLLDERNYSDWVDLFTEDGVYWVPAGDEPSPNEAVALIYDNQSRLKERLVRMKSSRFWAQQPATSTCRIVGNVTAVTQDGDEISVQSRLIMALQRGGDRNLLSGVCDYRLRVVGGDVLIASKTVRLIERDQYFDNLTFLI